MKNQVAYEERFGPLPFIGDETRSALNKARNSALAVTMRSPKAQSWTDVSVAERTRLVDAKMGDSLFSDLHATLYLNGHAYVHATSVSLETILEELRGNLKIDERRGELGPILHAAALTLLALILFCNLFHELRMNTEVSKAIEAMGKV